MNVQEIMQQMTLEEKAAFCSGHDFWHTKAVERLGNNSNKNMIHPQSNTIKMVQKR